MTPCRVSGCQAVDMSDDTGILTVLTTTDTEEKARGLAAGAVRERVAARDAGRLPGRITAGRPSYLGAPG